MSVQAAERALVEERAVAAVAAAAESARAVERANGAAAAERRGAAAAREDAARATARATAAEARAAVADRLLHAAVTASASGVVAAVRRRLAAARPAFVIADGASIDEFELIERLGRRTRPVHGNRCVGGGGLQQLPHVCVPCRRYYGANAAVFRAVHRASGTEVALKIMYARELARARGRG